MLKAYFNEFSSFCVRWGRHDDRTEGLMSADLVVFADDIETMATGRRATAVAVIDGVVGWLGPRREAREWIGPGTEVLDLGNATLLPGLSDCHSHPVAGAALTTGLSLNPVQSVAELRDVLAAHCLQLAPTDWVLAWGMQPTAFDGVAIDRELIDDAVGGRPTLIRMFDGHSALASTEALVRAGLNGTDSSSFIRDRDGRPTGFLVEIDAIERVMEAVPGPTRAEQAKRLRVVLEEMAAQGITSVHAMDFGAGSEQAYSAIESDGELPVRVHAYPWITPGMERPDWDELADSIGRGGRRWRIEGAKLFIDGTVDNGTAWLSEPDIYGESTKAHWPSPDRYAEAIGHLHHRGVQTATHAIGDQGVAFALRSLRSAGATPGGLRHRLEHLETISPSALQELSALGVTASMQPTHCTDYVAADGTDNWSKRLGSRRAAAGWPCADIAAHDIPLVLGSDWPIASFDLRHIIAAAQTRQRFPETASASPQSIDARSSVRGLTTTAAWLVGTEQSRGTIAVGKCADFSAFSVNPLKVEPAEFEEATNVATILHGTITHRTT